MKTIKMKLLLPIEILILAIIISLSVITLKMSSNALENNNGKTMSKIAEEGAAIVSSKVSEQLSILKQIAASDSIIDSSKSVDDKLAGLKDEIERNSYISIAIIDLNGNAKYSDSKTANLSNRDYFKKALSGKPWVSDPIVSKADKKLVVVYAVPIKENGNIIGVLAAAKDGNHISSITDDIKFGDTGTAYMISNTGVTIANTNKDLVIKMYNVIENSKKDPALKEFANIQRKMINREKGYGIYKYNGQNKFVTYAPVLNTTWSFAVAVAQSEVNSELNILTRFIVIFSCIFLVLAFIIVYFISDSFSKKIKNATNYIVTMASGDFTSSVLKEELNNEDELGTMIMAVDTMQSSIRDMLKSVVNNSNKIDNDSQKLSSISDEMSKSSESVALAIEEVTNGTGAQAQDLVTITEILNSFSQNLEEIIQKIRDVDNNSKGISSLAGKSSERIHELSESIANTMDTFKNFEATIKESGENINKINEITDLINSISEQTNLLALNAAIEAARAGEAGKGFSVVADEIRELAEQSKESSNNISKIVSDIYSQNKIMINSTNKVSDDLNKQGIIVDNALDSYENIIKAVDNIIPKIEDINNSTTEINERKEKILNKVESTSAVAEEVSASSEEINASSDEMSKLSDEVLNSANNLTKSTKEMTGQVKKFKL